MKPTAEERGGRSRTARVDSGRRSGQWLCGSARKKRDRKSKLCYLPPRRKHRSQDVPESSGKHGVAAAHQIRCHSVNTDAASKVLVPASAAIRPVECARRYPHTMLMIRGTLHSTWAHLLKCRPSTDLRSNFRTLEVQMAAWGKCTRGRCSESREESPNRTTVAATEQ